MVEDAEDELLVERIGHVLVLTLNRPQVANSLNAGLIGRLGEELTAARTDADVRAIVITGAGPKAFCAGTDLRDAAPVTAVEDQFAPPPLHLSRGLEVLKPVIAAINGYALGGGLELALACDLRIASTTASFGLPEPGIGTMPGAGGTQRLVRQLARAHAMHLLLTGDRIGAEQAERWGLVSALHPPDELRDAALDLAQRIAANGPLSMLGIKQAVTLGEGLPLAEAMRVERAIFNLLRDTADRAEGREAFREKRPPRFTGR
jgi:enoyl-CoA hydratase/carnithine racemase